MEVGDFIIVKGEVAKIICYGVIDNRKVKSVTYGNESNISIDDLVLNASGFVKTKDSAVYRCTLKDDVGNVKCTVNFNLDKYICEISMTIDMRPDYSQEIRVLSELQDFVKDKTSKELPIKIDELAAIFK